MTIGEAVYEFAFGEKSVGWNRVLAFSFLCLGIWFYHIHDWPWAMFSAFAFGLRGERAYQLNLRRAPSTT